MVTSLSPWSPGVSDVLQDTRALRDGPRVLSGQVKAQQLSHLPKVTVRAAAAPGSELRPLIICGFLVPLLPEETTGAVPCALFVPGSPYFLPSGHPSLLLHLPGLPPDTPPIS